MNEYRHRDAAQPKVPPLIHNWVSLLGVILTVSSFAAVLCLVSMDFFKGFSNPYMGVLTYLVAPGFLWLGLMIIAGGILWERRRRRRLAPGEIPQFPRIDLNNPRHRNSFILVSAFSIVFLMLSAVGSYRTYQFTESVGFCGRLCHTVMKPEYTAYTNSPHARVTCTECHIGPGATWFVRSKLSGAYQVYATLVGSFPRPIPTPIMSLRPAQETCEQCHWPQKFYGGVERVRTHFLSDEKNSPWTIRLLLKVGGGDPTHGPLGGIHWHMNVANRIDYVAKDEARQVIPWVRVTDAQGRVTVYQSTEEKLAAEQVTAGSVRRMDCIDCHNRPTHIFRSPNEALATSMLLGRIDPTIPFIKKNAAAALVQAAATQEEGVAQIAQKLNAAYASHRDKAKIQTAVAEVQKIYRDNFFPHMKSNWRAYPDNIGHLNWPGCTRCHDGRHRAAEGKKISDDCNSCHTIFAQGAGTKLDALSPRGMDFKHPGEEVPSDAPCISCHTGGPQD